MSSPTATSKDPSNSASSSSKYEEFQVVIMAAGGGSGLYPLTVDKAKSLLPIGPRPILGYQLHMLEDAGFEEVIVVCSQQHFDDFNHYVTQVYPDRIRVDLHPINEEEVSGTASVLSSLKDKIRMDFFVLSGDVVTTASLSDLADTHRLRSSSVTMLLKEYKDTHLKKERKELLTLRKHVVNYFGLVTEGSGSRDARVVLMKSTAQGDLVDVPKPLLWSEPNMKLHTNLVDGHIYIFRRWVLDLLTVEKETFVSSKLREMSSLRADLLPFLVNKLQPRSRERNLDIDLSEYGYVDHPLTKARLMSSHHVTPLSMNNDQIRCFALVVPSETFTCRANTLFSYSMINHAIANISLKFKMPWPKNQKCKFKETIVGQSTDIDDSVTIKNCVIGSHCKIGAGAMLSNTVVMNHCIIGDDVVIQNSIISENVTIEKKCDLNDVQLENGTVVKPEGVKLKNQAYLKSDF